jgi:hypothetical protein
MALSPESGGYFFFAVALSNKMMRYIAKYIASIVLVLFATSVANAGEMPCVMVEKALLNRMSYLNVRNEKDFSACIRAYRVCLLTYEGEVLKAQSIRGVTNENSIDSVELGIVQSPPNENEKLCLAGSFSGGSAAAWIFEGSRIRNDRAVKLDGMSKGRLNSDAVPARALANIIYDVYEKIR